MDLRILKSRSDSILHHRVGADSAGLDYICGCNYTSLGAASYAAHLARQVRLRMGQLVLQFRGFHPWYNLYNLTDDFADTAGKRDR